jgi:hypothetical protein
VHDFTISLSTVIASEAKQSILSLLGEMDCFASLAMTVSHDSAISPHAFFLREVFFYSRPPNRGRRECRAADAPDSHVCEGSKQMHTR